MHIPTKAFKTLASIAANERTDGHCTESIYCLTSWMCTRRRRECFVSYSSPLTNLQLKMKYLYTKECWHQLGMEEYRSIEKCRQVYWRTAQRPPILPEWLRLKTPGKKTQENICTIYCTATFSSCFCLDIEVGSVGSCMKTYLVLLLKLLGIQIINTNYF